MHQPEENNEEENKKLNEILKKHYFTFDVNGLGDLNGLIHEMLYGPQLDDTLFKELNKFTDAIFAGWGLNDIPEASTTSMAFIGKNKYGESVFKPKHFVVNELTTEYFNHVRQHAVHTLSQPEYYRGLHEILN